MASDHGRLGRQLDLFSVSEDVGPGLVLWHPKAARVRLELEDYWRRVHLARGYELVYSPHLGKSRLWETSGHLDFYRDSMFPPIEIDSQTYFVKPMNCPFHMEIYSSRRRSYRELPLRYAELGTVYRYERSGVLNGLLRVRGFTQDDAHIFCGPNDLESEIVSVVELVREFLGVFDFDDIELSLSTRPEKSIGSDADWAGAIRSLKGALRRIDVAYEIDEGGGAFYGPKLDAHVRDSLGRAWQISTVQFDFNLPERFGLTYVGPDGAEQRPFVVHRALFGSLERFFAILAEHYQGAFPPWLAPVQARVLPISDRHRVYAQEVRAASAKMHLRVDVDDRNEPLSARVRDGELEKIPYLLVVGDRELESGNVSVRRRGEKTAAAVATEAFFEELIGQSTQEAP